MEQRHKHADVIIAWAEGKDVQVWSPVSCRWYDLKINSPNFLADTEYRIKPPAKKYRVALLKHDTYTYTYSYTSTADTPEDADFFEKAPCFVRWLTDWIEYEE